MFTRIQARGFRSLKEIDVRLGEFHALVGPNGSGKTSFLDVLGFLSDLMRERGDLFAAVQKRTTFFHSLLWKGEGDRFDLAVEAKVPEFLSTVTPHEWKFKFVRYELSITENDGQLEVLKERLVLCGEEPSEEGLPFAWGQFGEFTVNGIEYRTLLARERSGQIHFRMEWGDEPALFPAAAENNRTALALNIGFIGRSPITAWFAELLERRVSLVQPETTALRFPSPPGNSRYFRPDGSGLPWLVESLRRNEGVFREWLDHVRTAIPEIADIVVIDREEDRHRYLMVHYANGAKVPSRLTSDGTLRLLLLTILAYLPDNRYMYLIEEPENGVHPRALETILDSLQSVYDGQVLIATHSMLVVNMLEPSQLLCFFQDDEGATRIVPGDKHPVMANWEKGRPDLGVIFASGILD